MSAAGILLALRRKIWRRSDPAGGIVFQDGPLRLELPNPYLRPAGEIVTIEGLRPGEKRTFRVVTDSYSTVSRYDPETGEHVPIFGKHWEEVTSESHDKNRQDQQQN